MGGGGGGSSIISKIVISALRISKALSYKVKSLKTAKFITSNMHQATEYIRHFNDIKRKGYYLLDV